MDNPINIADDAIDEWDRCLSRLESMSFRTNDSLYDFIRHSQARLRKAKEDLKKARA